MRAIITQEEWEEYQQLKAARDAKRKNHLTGKVVQPHELARPRIKEYLNGMCGHRMGLIDGHELFRVASEIATFTFEQCTGEKL